MASPVVPDTITDDNVEMTPREVVVEEIEEDNCRVLKIEMKVVSEPVSPPKNEAVEQEARSLARVSATRNFGNISPISDLLDDDDLDHEGNGDVELEAEEEFESADSGAGKVTPEPRPYPNAQTGFPRISDGRSSPILAYSPSLLKSPPSNGSSKSRNSNSPSTNGDRIQKRPRNIARMLDNISDHSSGEEEVNNVGVLMAKFTV